MKKHRKIPLRLLLGGLVFIGGFCVLFYPAVSDLWNQYRQTRLLQQYDRTLEELEEESLEQYWQTAKEYNAGLSGNTIGDAFGEDGETDTLYESALNLTGNGIMGYLSIPKIDVYLPIYHGTGAEALQSGIGHLYGTALPVGGEGTHTVLAGHRGLPSAALLTDLDWMEEGDLFYLYILDEVLAYEVVSIEVVEPTQTDALAVEAGEDLATLVTCTPYGVNTHRLLVHGSRVEYEPETAGTGMEAAVQTEALRTGSFAWMAYVLPAIGIAFVLLLILILYLLGKRRKGGRAGRRK
ncbi:MAG: class C sortase [Lachnospiraceae bacterium]|nr:class C sortase [Lachnospiraceae bacterium]